MKNKDIVKKSYSSMIEFERDFFPKAFSEKQAKKPADNQSIGVNLAKESFREIRQQAEVGKVSADI